jgi:CspA family cold shock protein
MATGVVKWFNNDKGYGFVKMDDEDESEVFVHHSAIDMAGFKSLKHGQQVEFSLYYGPKGLTASYLKQLDIIDSDTPIQDGLADHSASPPPLPIEPL